MKIQIGFSPCPNDTFIFDALVNHRIDTKGYQFEPILEDVETLNRWAMKCTLPITKLSYHGFLKVTDHYVMCRAGGALGFGVGPLLITNNPEKFLAQKSPLVLLPGEYTTAHLLFKLAYPELTNKQFVAFHQIENLLMSHQADAGVIIHENRFTYAHKGLHLIRDLGAWWEEETTLPIPLGGIALSKKLTTPNSLKIAELIRQSIEYAFQNPDASYAYVLQHAQEMDESVRRQHINLYVNSYSLDVGDIGIQAVTQLAERLSGLEGLKSDQKRLFL